MKKTIKSLLAIAIGAFAFTSCSDVPTPEGYNPRQGDGLVNYVPEGTGTATDPYNVAGVIEGTKDLPKGSSTSTDIYTTGYVAEVGEFNASFGNITFYITDNPEGKSTKFYCYRCLGLGNTKFTSADDIKLGDIVTVCGKVKNYNGTFEYDQGSYLVRLNDKTQGGGGGGAGEAAEPQGNGSQGNPYNVAGAIVKCKETGETATTEEYYIKGVVDAEFVVPDDNYKNATFDMVDEGYTQKFKAYRVLGPEGKKLKAGYTIPKGATVVVCSKIVNYRGTTPETVQTTNPVYNGTLVSVNGQAPELDGGGGGEGGGGETGLATYTKTVEGAVVTLTSTTLTPSSTVETVDFDTYGWENNTEPAVVTTTAGTSVTCGQGEGGSAPKFYTATHGVRFYAKNTLKLASTTKAIAKIVLNCDSYNGTDYVGNEQLYATNSDKTTTIVNEWTGTSGGTQIRVKTIEITYAQ